MIKKALQQCGSTEDRNNSTIAMPGKGMNFEAMVVSTLSRYCEPGERTHSGSEP